MSVMTRRSCYWTEVTNYPGVCHSQCRHCQDSQLSDKHSSNFQHLWLISPRLSPVWSLLGTDCYLTKISFEISCYFSPRARRRHQPPAACSGYTLIPLKTLELKIILLTTGKTFNLFQAICRNKYLDIMFQFLIIVSVIRSGDLKTKATRECTYLLLYTAELSHIKRVNLKAGFARPYALKYSLITCTHSLNHWIIVLYVVIIITIALIPV